MFLIRKFSKKRNWFHYYDNLMNNFVKITLILLILSLGYYTMILEPNNIQIERQVIIIKDLPQSFDKIRIVHLSDFHSLWFGWREKKVLKIVEELKPNFVFITGDFVDPVTKVITDRKLTSVRIFWQKLGERYKDRIFGVLGNHDNEAIKKLLEEKGILILNNENKKLILEEEYIYLIGVNDPFTGRDDLLEAMRGIEEDKPRILLAHGPEIMKETESKKMDLILVGHTHGGQVNLPLLGQLIQPLSKYGRQYTKGLFKIESTYLHVNRGIGTSFFPIRFNCPAEIIFFELLKK